MKLLFTLSTLELNWTLSPACPGPWPAAEAEAGAALTVNNADRASCAIISWWAPWHDTCWIYEPVCVLWGWAVRVRLWWMYETGSRVVCIYCILVVAELLVFWYTCKHTEHEPPSISHLLNTHATLQLLKTALLCWLQGSWSVKKPSLQKKPATNPNSLALEFDPTWNKWMQTWKCGLFK